MLHTHTSFHILWLSHTIRVCYTQCCSHNLLVLVFVIVCLSCKPSQIPILLSAKLVVLLWEIEGPVWYTIDRHFPITVVVRDQKLNHLSCIVTYHILQYQRRLLQTGLLSRRQEVKDTNSPKKCYLFIQKYPGIPIAKRQSEVRKSLSVSTCVNKTPNANVPMRKGILYDLLYYVKKYQLRRFLFGEAI